MALKKLLALAFLPLLLLYSRTSLAYPDFIGYGYSSCITCHYNGAGGGALNDYGRALYATEITARDIFPAAKDEEEIAAQSGFLGSKPLPWWFRPGIKYRGLWMKMNPGSEASIERFINMQNDVNLTFFFDKKQKATLVTTTSYTGLEDYYGKTNSWFIKEYFLRWKQSNNLWFYLGQMDKIFGIRNVDHSAVNRKAITLGQFDQSQSFAAHWTYPQWDIAAQAFFGNINQEDPSHRQKGYTTSGEYQVFEKFKVGGSFLISESDLEKWRLLAFTTRMGVSKGASVIAEAGFRERTKLLTNQPAELGTYALIQTLVPLRRGYNLLSVFEHYKHNIEIASPETMRLSIGALMFPLPRLELRMMAINGKSYLDSSGSADAWALQGQVHVSY